MVHVTVCERCGAHYFPARLRCRQCGGTAFLQQPINEARVVGVTHVSRLPNPNEWQWLLELEAAHDVKLIAVSAFEPSVGQTLGLLQQEDGAVVASAKPL